MTARGRGCRPVATCHRGAVVRGGQDEALAGRFIADPPTVPVPVPAIAREAPADSRRRGRAVLAVALATALLVVGAGAIWWLATTPPASGSVPAPVAAPAAPASPAAVASPAPEDGPALTDTRGRPLPATAAQGARRLFAALTAGDQQTLRAACSPDRTAASWEAVRLRLAGQAVRAGLLEALRRPPSPRPEVAYLYSARDLGVGLTAAGRVAFFGTGQRAAAPSSPTPVPTGRTTRAVPFACEDSVVGDGLDTPECGPPAAGADQGSRCSAETTICPAGYREGVVSRANPFGCDFDAISARNPCQWRYTPAAGDGPDRPDPVTPAQRWAACRLSGFRQFC